MEPLRPYHLPILLEPAVMKDNNERRGSGSGVATTLNKTRMERWEPYHHLPPGQVYMRDNDEGWDTGVATRQPLNPPAEDDPSFWKVVNHRVSVRSFTHQPVPDALLEHCLRLARLAPSAGNLQAYQVVMVKRQDQRNALAQAAQGQSWIAEAPVVLVFIADLEQSAQKYHERGRSLYAIQDATIAAVYLQLALEAVGLSSCWVGAFRDKEVAEIVGIQNLTTTTSSCDACEYPSLTNFRPVVIMPVGYAAERHERHHHRHHHRHRRSLKQFVHHGVLGGKEEHGAKHAGAEKVTKLSK